MSERELLLSHGPCREIWQLGAIGPDGLLIGWTGFSDRDAGMPRPVASLLAAALVSMNCVTFLASERQPPPTVSRPVVERGLFPRWLRRLSTNPEQWLITSDDPETVAAAFDDAGAPWWLQGQVLIGTALGGAPPELPSKRLSALRSDDWCAAARALSWVDWVLRPGVDGDVAGLCPRNATISHDIRAAMVKSALSFDLHLEDVSERDFTARLK